MGTIPCVCCENIKFLLSTERNQDDDVTSQSMMDLTGIDGNFIHQMAEGHQGDNITLDSMADTTGVNGNVDHLAFDSAEDVESCGKEETHNDAGNHVADAVHHNIHNDDMDVVHTSMTNPRSIVGDRPHVFGPSSCKFTTKVESSHLPMTHRCNLILFKPVFKSNGLSKVKKAWDLILPLCTILAHTRQSWEKLRIAPNVPQSHRMVSIARQLTEQSFQLQE